MLVLIERTLEDLFRLARIVWSRRVGTMGKPNRQSTVVAVLSAAILITGCNANTDGKDKGPNGQPLGKKSTFIALPKQPLELYRLYEQLYMLSDERIMQLYAGDATISQMGKSYDRVKYGEFVSKTYGTPACNNGKTRFEGDPEISEPDGGTATVSFVTVVGSNKTKTEWTLRSNPNGTWQIVSEKTSKVAAASSASSTKKKKK